MCCVLSLRVVLCVFGCVWGDVCLRVVFLFVWFGLVCVMFACGFVVLFLWLDVCLRVLNCFCYACALWFVFVCLGWCCVCCFVCIFSFSFGRMVACVL